MKTITITLNNDKQTEGLVGLLRALDFVESVEVNDEDVDLSEEEMSIVEERWAAYKKNPKSTATWTDVKNTIRKKHGL